MLLEAHVFVKSKKMDLSGFAIIQFAINCLKKVNDTNCHISGDELIVGLANYILNAFHNYVRCYRIWKDEFTLIAKF